jgi:Zn-dependent peptidase ImmA (M78 family)
VLLESIDVQTIATIPLHEPNEDSIDEIESIAERVRLELRVPPGPVQSMTRILESVGAVIFRRPMPPKIDALVDGMPGTPPIVLLSEALLGGRQRFTLAHELAHLVMHNALNYSFDVMERQANQFASAFLMPAREIKAKLRNLTMERLVALSAEWRVSVQALVRRARDLYVITERQCRAWFEQLTKSGYRTSEPIPIPTELPSLLTSLIRLHMDDLRYSVEELAYALSMEVWEFRKYYLGENPLQVVKKRKKVILRPFADGS